MPPCIRRVHRQAVALPRPVLRRVAPVRSEPPLPNRTNVFTVVQILVFIVPTIVLDILVTPTVIQRVGMAGDAAARSHVKLPALPLGDGTETGRSAPVQAVAPTLS